jgi:ring-1,2-phenylacetyl-CoA epoxidase subunit PaaD
VSAAPLIDRDRALALAVAAEVADPEIPVLTIGDHGVLRDAPILPGGVVEVDITPTYSGCPAMPVIAADIVAALAAAGFAETRVRTVLQPAWSTDWISPRGREALRAYGIAPPPPCGAPRAPHRDLFGAEPPMACPRCGSEDTAKLAEFGSTPCKALWRCAACREPFDAFKCL